MLYQLSYASLPARCYAGDVPPRCGALERETGIEPATNSLEGCDSTIELLPPLESTTYRHAPKFRVTASKGVTNAVTIDDFIQERVYLKGVSPRTVEWYQGSFRAFANALGSKQTIIARIAQLKARGASHITINSYLRCINAYFRWLHVEHGQDAIRIPKLKEEQKILQTLSTDAIVKITKFRPKTTSRNLFRAHLIVLTMLDTGLRISEVLGLVVADVDFDNLLLRVNGKGGKHRLVPFSFELRKILFRYTRSKTRLLFGTKNETQVSTVNVGRDIGVLGRKLGMTGVRFSPHTMRHTFAVTFLRNGGDVYVLSRILGHSSITTTTVYLRSLGIETLSMAHQKFSPLVAAQRGRG